jgi:peroxiredoxin family protein
MAKGARMEGIEASLFFTFFGLDAIIKKRMNDLKVATVGNPGMRMPTLLGALPGMSAFATGMMKKEIEKLDIPPIGEFITMIHDAGCEIYACRATVDMFHLKREDFCDEMDDVIWSANSTRRPPAHKSFLLNLRYGATTCSSVATQCLRLRSAP